MRVLIVAFLGACSFSGPEALPDNEARDAGPAIDGATVPIDASIAITPDAEPPDAAPTLTIHLNVGAPTDAAVYNGVDFPGTWIPDQAICSGTGITFADGLEIGGTIDDLLFRRNHYGTVVCNFDLPSDNYTVTLVFAEIFRDGCGSNSQTRDVAVSLEGTEVDTFDVVLESNGCVIGNGNATPFARIHQVEVTDGQLNVVVSGDNNNATAILSAISVSN